MNIAEERAKSSYSISEMFLKKSLAKKNKREKERGEWERERESLPRLVPPKISGGERGGVI